MGGKYEVIGWEYPYDGTYDLYVTTNSYFKARKAYRKAKKMFYSAFIKYILKEDGTKIAVNKEIKL